MDILFHVSTAAGGRLLYPLLLAARRADCRVGAFFTHEGVLGLRDTDLAAALIQADRAVVCEESWHRFCPGLPCPVEAGSQTSNSALMGEARKVVSL
ncbi:hypothetical protein [Sulfuritalea sp.]|uniref:hypothetical protein n=1 Tax=Sulfuritalea sp. TaxID=2480090 RepID=UPI00286E29A8|nr:hypothetical protein [Sulfuritalea sp.]